MRKLLQKPTVFGLPQGKNENVPEYLPILAEIIKLKIEKASALTEGGEHYDALIDEYESNISTDEISKMFQNLRPTLVNLRKEILSKQKLWP